jgi:putative transposase
MQQLREALPGDQDYKYLPHDRHKTFSADLNDEVESWGIGVMRSPVRMPTANAHCERLIGNIRRECLDFLIPLNESHLRRILGEWTCHYHGRRPHRALGPGIPDSVQEIPPVCKRTDQSSAASQVIAKPILNGLHHEYRWAKAA